MQKCRAVVFDADGTLFDTFELIVSAYRHVAETHNLRVPEPNEVRSQLGKALPDIFKYFYPDQDIQTLLNTNNTYVAANTMNSKAFSGVHELLRELTNEGITVAILTGGGAKVHNVLKQHKLDQYFTSIVHHERVQNPKPDPEGFLLACTECHVKPGETVMVGDTTFDIETGKNAHALATIAVTYGFGGAEDLERVNADYTANDIFDVKMILSKLVHET
jgi:HAD superfamily hydrolase (TIGR01662 family)